MSVITKNSILKEKKKRLNLSMPMKTEQMITDIQRRIGAESMTEVFRRALALFDVVTAKEEEGGRFYVHYGDGTQSEIHFL